MAKVQYKSDEGILHIGGGRFFYAKDPVEVPEKEKAELLKNHKDLEEVEEKKQDAKQGQKEPEQDKPKQEDEKEPGKESKKAKE